MPKSKKSWFRMVVAADKKSAELFIFDEIGTFGVTPAMFNDQLTAIGDDISELTVHINSPGGELFAGLAIFNMLDRVKQNGTRIIVRIEGVAASIASYIAMVGDLIIMPENAHMMIHNPSGIVMGNSEDMRELADLLDRFADSIATAYARKSGLSDSEISEIMDAETWFTAEEAVEAGFADEIAEPVRAAARFDLSRYEHPPRMSGKRSPTMTPTTTQTAAPAATTTTAAAAPPAVPAVAAAAPAAETPEQMQARITAEVTARVAEVTALCTMVGKPERVADFVAKGLTVNQVLATLNAETEATKPKPTTTPTGAAATTTITAAHQPQLTSEQLQQQQQQEDVSDLVKAVDPMKIWANANKIKAYGLGRQQ